MPGSSPIASWKRPSGRSDAWRGLAAALFSVALPLLPAFADEARAEEGFYPNLDTKVGLRCDVINPAMGPNEYACNGDKARAVYECYVKESEFGGGGGGVRAGICRNKKTCEQPVDCDPGSWCVGYSDSFGSYRACAPCSALSGEERGTCDRCLSLQKGSEDYRACVTGSGKIQGVGAGLLQAKLEIPIPYIDFANPVKNNQAIHAPFLAQYVAGIYKFLLGVAGVLAATMMIVGGFQYLTAGGDKGRVEKGRKRIMNALIGLILAFGSYAILWTINPSLVNFGSLAVSSVSTEFISLQPIDPDQHPEATDETPKSAGGKCRPADVAVQKFVGISRKRDANCTTTHDIKLAEGLKPDIVKAAKELYEETAGMFGGPYKFRGGGFRETGQRGDGLNKTNLGSQAGKWESKCEAQGVCGNVCNPYGTKTPGPNAVPNPLNCSHTTGYALDVYCEKKKFKLKDGSFVTTNDRVIYVPCQLKFEEIMTRNGFCRLKHEIWHYEKPAFTCGCDTKWAGSWTKNFGTDERRNKCNFTGTYKDCKGVYKYYNNGCSGECLGEVDETFAPVSVDTPVCK